MSETWSTSSRRRYGWSRVCRAWGIPRSTVYDWRRRSNATGESRARRGRRPEASDEDLLVAIRNVINAAPLESFHGEGYRKVWARLRHRGLRADKERIRRLTGEQYLLASTRTGKPRGPRAHEGTIIPLAPNILWGTDAKQPGRSNRGR